MVGAGAPGGAETTFTSTTTIISIAIATSVGTAIISVETGRHSYRLGTAAILAIAEALAVAVTVRLHFLPAARMPEVTGNTILIIAVVLHIGTAPLRTDSEEQRAVIHLQSARRVLDNSLADKVAIYPAFALAVA